jgi:RNA polymerase sigma-70 factor, ECF subfamily
VRRVSGGANDRVQWVGSSRKVPPKMTDDDVLAMVARGDRKGAVVALVLRHGSAVYAHCVRVLKDRTLAQDAHQQVFLQVYRDIQRFERRSALRTWIFQIATNRCLDLLRSPAHRNNAQEDEEAVAEMADPSPDPDERLDQAEQIQALEACMNTLKPGIRETVQLKFQSGMSYEELSRLLGEKATTIQARVARALKSLRECLERKGVEP